MATTAARGLALAARTVTRQSLICRSSRLPGLNPTRRFLASYPSHEVVGMPSLSPTMEAGTIASWNVKEGGSFVAGDVFCEVETDKATVSFEAQDDGVVAKILAEAGPAEIKCGEPIMITVEDESDVDAFASYVVESGAGAAAPAAPEPAAAAPPAPAAPAAPAPAAAAPPSSAQGGRVVASPLAHMLAKELGHDIAAISGSGPGGRVIASDVKEFVPSAAVEQPAAAVASTAAASTVAPAQAIIAAAPPMAGAGFTDYPLSESAQQVAAQLTHSKQNVPHYYLTIDVSMDKLLETRSKLNETIGEDGTKLGMYELVLKAAGAAMKAVPSANASWMDSVVRVYDSVDINVVVGNGDALYTPVIRNVGARGVKGLSDDLSTFVSALEEETPALGEEFSAMGTFTVINLGMYGIRSCAPIIREPQACALALGAMENRIVYNEERDTEVRDTDEEGDGEFKSYKKSVMMTATLSCDHRVVDGAVGAQWLSAFKSHVENPETLLL